MTISILINFIYYIKILNILTKCNLKHKYIYYFTRNYYFFCKKNVIFPSEFDMKRKNGCTLKTI